MHEFYKKCESLSLKKFTRVVHSSPTIFKCHGLIHITTTCHLIDLIHITTTCHLIDLIHITTTCHLIDLLHITTTCHLIGLIRITSTCHHIDLLHITTTCHLNGLIHITTACHLIGLIQISFSSKGSGYFTLFNSLRLTMLICLKPNIDHMRGVSLCTTKTIINIET